MEKQSRTEYIGETKIFGSYECVDVNELISFLVKNIEIGCTHVQFNASTFCDSVDEISIELVKLTYESDEEYNNRIENERLMEQQKLLERRQEEYNKYLRLKQKFES